VPLIIKCSVFTGQQNARDFLYSLDLAVSQFRGQTFAKNTRKTDSTQQTSYLEFCRLAGIASVRLSSHDLGRYIAYLAQRLCYSSVRQYLSVVRVMHLEAGFPNPMADS
jgi:hypothetical protein